MYTRACTLGMGNKKDLYFFDMVNRQANASCTQARDAGRRLARLLGQPTEE